MCIKLTRHFQCSGTVEHASEYVVRCSTPFIFEATPSCLRDGDDVDTRDEWYAEPCPECCTGEIAVPKTEPVRVETSTNCKSPGDITASDAASESVKKYVGNLAAWLFAYISFPRSGFGGRDIFCKDGVWVEGATMTRQLVVLREIVCRVEPKHGCVWRLVHPDTPAGGVVPEFLPANDGCDCLSTHRPSVCNWASQIRRSVSTDVFRGIMDPDLDDFGIGQAGLQDQQSMQYMIVKVAEFIDREAARLNRKPSLRPLETLETRLEDVMARYHGTGEVCSRLAPPLAPQRAWHSERTRRQLQYTARESLLIWVRQILSCDSGISIERANAIVAEFIRKVVQTDEGEEEYEPGPQDPDKVRLIFTGDPGVSIDRASEMLAEFLEKLVRTDKAGQNGEAGAQDPYKDHDWCKLLAHAANKYPAEMTTWVIDSVGLALPHLLESFETEYDGWVSLDRSRAAAVYSNMARADEGELDELRRRGDDTCCICLETFDDHDNAVSKLPVQNRVCRAKGHRHWCGQACLVKFARARHSVSLAAPAPHCPICRTKFAEFAEPDPDTL